MSLLTRIAVSNGNPTRKEAANRAITQQAGAIIYGWNKELRREILRRIMADILTPPAPASSTGWPRKILPMTAKTLGS